MEKSLSRVIVVTGSYKGLGFETLRHLRRQEPNSTLIMAARTNDKMAPSLKLLSEEFPETSGRVVPKTLEIGNPDSHYDFKKWIDGEFGKVDVLVNNAGIAPKNQSSYEAAQDILETNFHGTVDFTQEISPLITEDTGNIVFVTGFLGVLKAVPNKDIVAALSREDLEYSELMNLADQYLHEAENGPRKVKNWPKSPYSTSKLLLNVFTKVYAKSLHNLGIKVNSCCPGWCRTDMGGEKAPKSAEEGAKIMLKLAQLTGPVNGLNSGHFWSDDERKSLFDASSLDK